MMNMRPESKKNVRRRRKPKKMVKRKRQRMTLNTRLLEKVVEMYARRKPPTEMTILLRMINILGLTLLVLIMAILSSRENFKEIVEFGRWLFQAIP
jgi:hypothetical protein